MIDANEIAGFKYIKANCNSFMYTPEYDACFSRYYFIWRLWQWMPWAIAGVVIIALIGAYLFRSKLETALVNFVAGVVRWKRRVQSRIAEKAKE